MSVKRASRRKTPRPSAFLRFRTRPRLPRLTALKLGLSRPTAPGITRVESPAGGSILITSAPRSASTIAQYGPAITCVTSSTRRRSSARRAAIDANSNAHHLRGRRPDRDVHLQPPRRAQRDDVGDVRRARRRVRARGSRRGAARAGAARRRRQGVRRRHRHLAVPDVRGSSGRLEIRGAARRRARPHRARREADDRAGRRGRGGRRLRDRARVRPACGDAGIDLRHPDRAHARQLSVGRDLQPPGRARRTGGGQGSALHRPLPRCRRGVRPRPRQPHRRGGCDRRCGRRARERDCGERAVDGARDKGNDPPRPRGAPPSARRRRRPRGAVLHERGLSRRRRGVPRQAQAAMDGAMRQSLESVGRRPSQSGERMKRFILIAALAASALPITAQSEKLDFQMLGRIRDEGLSRSQVMDHISWLSDVYGPRLTGSPAIQQASEWAMKRFREWGLASVHQERWSFGKGWSLVRFSAHLVEPQVQPIVGFPHEWSSATRGTITADVVRVRIATDADFATYRGTLAGKIVLTQPARRVRMLEGPIILRMDDQYEKEAETTPVPAPAAGRGRGPSTGSGQVPATAAQAFRDKLEEFYAAEGVVATFDRGSDSDMADGGSTLSWQQQHPDGGTIFPSGSFARDDKVGKSVPGLTIAVEHYNRMIRVLDKGLPVRVELDVETKYYDEAGMNGFNTIADLPGGDLASEIVLLGAHFDSHPYATGATDNATGSAAMMEAVRILKASGVKPRRTIRIGLWGGEEQGLLGSQAYVREHLADVDTMTLKPEHARLSAYFNSDNGTGRVRGVWLQSNMAVRPIFSEWIAPLRDLGVTTPATKGCRAADLWIPSHGFAKECGPAVRHDLWLSGRTPRRGSAVQEPT